MTSPAVDPAIALVAELAEVRAILTRILYAPDRKPDDQETTARMAECIEKCLSHADADREAARADVAEARGLAWRLRRSVMVLASGSGDPALRAIFGAVWDAVRSDADMIPDTDEWRP